jgi:hypothetical protein
MTSESTSETTPMSLRDLLVTFEAEAPSDAWRTLARDVGMQTVRGNKDAAWFVALPSDPGGGRYLSADLHSMKHGRWTFRLSPTPQKPPPPMVKRSSDRVGGYPVALATLADGWPASHRLKCEVTASYVLSSCAYAPRPELGRHLNWSEELEVDGTTWRFVQPLVTVEVRRPGTAGSRLFLSSTDDADRFLAIYIHTTRRRFSRSLFTNLEKSSWRILQKLMTPR